MQAGPENPLVGVEGRVKILNALGNSLLENPDIFGQAGRPGHLVDHLLKMHPDKQELPEFTGSDDVIVEWRALTVVLLDNMLALVNKKLVEKGAKTALSLAQILEAGT